MKQTDLLYFQRKFKELEKLIVSRTYQGDKMCQNCESFKPIEKGALYDSGYCLNRKSPFYKEQIIDGKPIENIVAWFNCCQKFYPKKEVF